MSLQGAVTSPGFSRSKSCVYVFENSYKHLCKRKINACKTHTFFSYQCCLSMAWVKGIFLLLFFYPSSDKLHLSAVILSTTLSKWISYLFPSRPPTIKAHSCCISFFFFSFLLFFFLRRKNNVFLRWLNAFFSFQGVRTVCPEGQSCKLTIKKPSPLHTQWKRHAHRCENGKHTRPRSTSLPTKSMSKQQWALRSQTEHSGLGINTSFSSALKTLYEVAGGSFRTGFFSFSPHCLDYFQKIRSLALHSLP